MTTPPDPIDRAKAVAARRACDYVEAGMRVGLGTGSTAAWMVRRLGERVRAEGLSITAVPTSARTADLARDCDVPLTTLEEAGWLDLTIDGADEVDADMNLIKGGGGALLHEKIVAAASDRMVVIVDDAKVVDTLGAFPLPVEVIPFGHRATRQLIEEGLEGMDVDGHAIALRMTGDAPFRTDEGNLVLDLSLGRIGRPGLLSAMLNRIPGVVENGLFLDMADVVVSGRDDGTVEIRDLSDGSLREEGGDVTAADLLYGELED
ncbi:ribose-5-phosphate isomerase RpiA [Jannaschia sp. LMIT008]|uniref:ribose-5-phosphate isomerase RpiA n=1 Tax=Jannaschia maritima TaxID=3032585 RepID=UPI0028114D0D|nr:ribose-5-phosphate isomerase RpiA [Jannaschia sp. LMIT008]